jgi:hypothetical protein
MIFSPSRSSVPWNSVSAVNVRHMFFTGDVQRSISSIAPGSKLGSACNDPTGSRLRSNCSVPPDKVWRVVSSPPIRISRVSVHDLVVLSRCPSTSACTRTLTRSSVGCDATPGDRPSW